MSWTVLLLVQAQIDLQEARDWYEARQPGLGGDFIEEMAIAVAKLREAADRHPEYYRGFRRALLRRFPYKAFYLIEGDVVTIFRVLHDHQDHVRRLRRV